METFKTFEAGFWLVVLWTFIGAILGTGWLTLVLFLALVTALLALMVIKLEALPGGFKAWLTIAVYGSGALLCGAAALVVLTGLMFAPVR